MKFSRISMILAAAVVLAGTVGILTHGPAVAQSSGCGVNSSELAVDQEEQSALELINALRADIRAPALSLSPTLGQAAAHKSVTMAANGSFSHDDPGRSFTQRIRDCGYSATPNVAENIAVGVDTGRAVVQMWRDSPAHHRIMLDPTMKAVGIARVRGAHGWFWTADFGGMPDGGASTSSAERQPATQTNASVAPTTGPAASTPSTPDTLTVGAPARVATDDGDCLNVRSGPGRTATIVTCLADGTAVRIAGGPISADGITWWLLEGLGWAAGEYLSAGGRR